MKKISLLRKIVAPGVLLVAFMIFSSDIIPENTHSVSRTVVITNCDEFSDIQFVGYITGVMVDEDNMFYNIQQNKALSKGYHLNALRVFGIRKARLKSLGGVEALTEEYVLDKVTPYDILSSSTYYVDEDSPLESEQVFYSIVKLSDRTYQAKLTKRILNYNNNTSETITY